MLLKHSDKHVASQKITANYSLHFSFSFFLCVAIIHLLLFERFNFSRPSFSDVALIFSRYNLLINMIFAATKWNAGRIENIVRLLQQLCRQKPASPALSEAGNYLICIISVIKQ